MLAQPVHLPIFTPIAQAVQRVLGSSFNPATLFADGSKGVLYDNNDLSTFYLDAAMTTQATVNGLVGAQRDKSGNGLHRTQTTTGSKPILRGTPVGSNLVTNGDFASGTSSGFTQVNGNTGGSSVISGELNVVSGAGGSGGYYQDVSVPVNSYVRIRVTGRKISGAGAVRFQAYNGAGFGTLLAQLFDVTTVAAAQTYERWFGPITSGVVRVYCYADISTTGGFDDISVFDVSADSVTAPYGLQFDGFDDFMQTAAVDFTATDKMGVCMGVRKLSDSAQGIVVELTASVAANNGSFYLAAPNSAAANFAFASKGTASATDIEAGFAAPLTAVLTGIGNISGDSALLRTNGVAGTAVTTDQGTGNYSNAILYFGRRGGTSLPYNGLDYGGIIVGKALTAAQLASVERWVAQRTGVTL